MPGPIPIRVECHAGYKADEYPTCFYANSERHDIATILDRWYQGDINPEFPVADYFKIITTSNEQYILKHEIEKDLWYLI